MHRWNRATADASLVLLTVTMALGPLARIWSPLRTFLPFRREFGIYSMVLALVHIVIVFDGWLEWSIWRFFGSHFHPALGRNVMVEHGFGLANFIGIVALAYGVVLTITSNNWSVRIFSGPTWKFLQTGAYVLWMLVVAHTAYFLFMHFQSFHRPLPVPNPLRWPFVGLVVMVFALRSAAFIRTWRHRRRMPRETSSSDP